MEWLPPKEDDSSNMQKVLAILQKHVCDDKSVAVNATSRAIFNKASFAAHFSAKRVKLNPTKTDCLIVAKSVEEVAVENPRSIYHQVCAPARKRSCSWSHVLVYHNRVASLECVLPACITWLSDQSALLAMSACRWFACPQLFGLVEVKKPEAYKSKLDRWRAQASGQFLGINYIVFRCMAQQPIGAGIPVLLTSFKDGQAILFIGTEGQEQDSISEISFDSARDAVELFRVGIVARQAASIRQISVSDLTTELFGSPAPNRRDEPAAEPAHPRDPNILGPPQLSMRARFNLAQADYAAAMQAVLGSSSSPTSDPELANLATWLPYLNNVMLTLSGGTRHLPTELHEIMQEDIIRRRGPPPFMYE